LSLSDGSGRRELLPPRHVRAQQGLAALRPARPHLRPREEARDLRPGDRERGPGRVLAGSQAVGAVGAIMKTAFIGLGRMGSGMAARLLAAGHEVRVFNRSREKAQPLQERGARVCDSVREAASGVDAIVTMTADDRSSRAVWMGERGALAADIASGALAI